MIQRLYDNLPLLHFELFEPFAELACGVSTRTGPMNLEFNLAPVRGPDRGARSANWLRIASSLGLTGLFAQLQVHECGIVHVDGQPAGFAQTPTADASFTAHAGIGLLAFSADCPLVAVYQRGVAVGVAHASWRCTTGLIVQRLIERMAAEAGCDPTRMFAAVAPSACPRCYEVGPEVYHAAYALPDRDACFVRSRNDRFLFDLWQAANQQLLAAGVPQTHVQFADLCTIHDHPRFFSYRREGAGVGAFGLMIGRRE